LVVDEKGIAFKLKSVGLRLHPNSWCNRHLRGLSISVLSPVRETSEATYELTLELGDLSPVGRGEDFASLLKRGTYVIRCDKGSEPRIVSYRQTCCEKTSQVLDRKARVPRVCPVNDRWMGGHEPPGAQAPPAWTASPGLS
jgi:hypothetical protein